MTNSQSVEEDGIVAGNIFAMLNNANRGLNRMKFISLATVPFRFWGGVERRTDSVPDLRFTIGGNEDFGFLAKRSRGVNRFG